MDHAIPSRPADSDPPHDVPEQPGDDSAAVPTRAPIRHVRGLRRNPGSCRTANVSPGGAKAAGRLSPRSWGWDPVVAGYRKVLTDLALGKWATRSAIVRHVAVSAAGEEGSGPADGPAVLGPVDQKHIRSARARLMALCAQAAPQNADQPAVGGGFAARAGVPSVVVMVRGHVPVRAYYRGKTLMFAVMCYSHEGGLRRVGELPPVTYRRCEVAFEDARHAFVQLRREILALTAGGLGHIAGGPAGAAEADGSSHGPLPDEIWLSRQLTEATGGLSVLPVELQGAIPAPASHGRETVDLDGEMLRIGAAVCVRLESRSGLVLTEPATLLGVERLGAATRLILRDSDGVINTCWTRGPGWTRRVVPMPDADVFGVSVSRLPEKRPGCFPSMSGALADDGFAGDEFARDESCGDGSEGQGSEGATPKSTF